MANEIPDLDALRIERAPLKTTRRRRRWPWLLLILLVGLAAWWKFRAPPLVVKTAIARSASAENTADRTLLHASGYVTTRLDATVSSKVTGKVAEILVDEGMKVEKGQVLARLDDANIRTGLALAEARVAAARKSLKEAEPLAKLAEMQRDRLRAVANPRAISRYDLDAAEAEANSQRSRLERLRAEIEVASRAVDDWQQQLDDTVIRAPFSGVVTTKDSQPGEMISPISAGGGFTRTGICTLVDMSSLEIEVDVGESFINRVAKNQAVEATLDAYPDWKIPCKVIAIIPTADRQKATVKVRVGFAETDPRILPQMGVKVAFLDEEKPAGQQPAGVIIPRTAVVRNAEQKIVWVVRDGKAVRLTVSAEEPRGGEMNVTTGLATGETVIVNPPDEISPGQPVTTAGPKKP